MNNEDLNKMESVLGIRFPSAYRAWAETLPTSKEAEEQWQWAFNDVEWLIAANQRLREHGMGGLHWPPNLICIGDWNDGITFFDSDNSSAGVFDAHIGSDPYYLPNDYSDCHISSIEDFCKS